MATLKFAVQADFEKVVRLRKEIGELERQLKTLGNNAAPNVVKELEQRLVTCTDEMNRLAQQAAAAGAQFDEAAAAMEQIKKIDLGIDTSTPQGMLDAFNKVIRTNQAEIAEASKQLREWQKDATEAFNAGNQGTFNTINEDIKAQIQHIHELTEETENYKAAMNTLEVSQGLTPSMTPTAGAAPEFYADKEAYDSMKNLREEVENLRAELGSFEGDDKGFVELNQTLIESEDKLRAMQSAAAEAAVELGGDLGARASEASATFYELSDALAKQEAEVASLKEQTAAAAEELQKMQESGDPAKIDAAQNTYQRLASSLANAENNMRGLQIAQQQASSAWQQASNEVAQHDSVLVQLLGGQEKYNEIVSKLPPVAQGAITSITGMTGAAKAFIATPLGAIIGAIVIAIQALTTWFKQSKEGQMAFAKVSGYVSGVLGQLKEIVFKVGETIFKAFSNPKQAVIDLWEAIKTNIMNRIKALGGIFSALGDIMKATFELNTDGITAGFGKLTDQVVQLNTGVEDLAEKMKDYAEGINDAAKKTSELATREEKLRRQRSEWQKEEAKLDAKIAEARTKMYSGTDAERLKATQEAEELINKKYAKRLEFAEAERDIIRERNSLTTNSQEDEDKLNQAEAAVTNVEAEKNNALMMFKRRGSSMESRMDKAGDKEASDAQKEQERLAKEAADRAKAQAKYADDLKEQQKQLDLANQEQHIANLEDGYEKEYQVIALNYEKKKAAIAKQEREMIAALADNNFSKWMDEHPQATEAEQTEFRMSLTREGDKNQLTRKDLTEEQQRALQISEAEAETARVRAEEKVLKKVLKANQDFNAKRLAEQEDYNAQAKVLADAAAKEQDPAKLAAIEDAQKQLTENHKKRLLQINTDEANSLQKTSKLFVELFENAADKSTKEIERIVAESKALLEYLKNTDSADIQSGFGFTAEQLRSLKDSPEKLKAIGKQTKQLDDIAKKSNPFKALGNAFKDAFGKSGDEKKDPEAKFKNLGRALGDVASMATDATAQLSEVFKAAGNESAAAAIEGIGQAMSTVGNVAKGFAEGGLIGGIAAAAGEAMGYIANAFAAAARHEAALKKIQQEASAYRDAWARQQIAEEMAAKNAQTIFGTLDYTKAIANVGALEKSYKNLSGAITDLDKVQVVTGHKKTGLFGWGAGKDTYTNVLQLYPELIDAQGNFNTEMAETIMQTRNLDDESKATFQNIIDYAKQAEEAEKALKDYLTGIFGNFGKDISNALVDAFKNGGDAAAKFGQSVSNMLEGLAQQMVYSLAFGDILESASNEAETIMKDKNLTNEQRFAKLSDLVGDTAQLVAGQQEMAIALMDTFKQEASANGVDLWGAGDQEASQKGFATMSQDEGRELNGRFAALQIAGETISQNVLDFNGKLADITLVNTSIRDISNDSRDILAQGLLELQSIRENTEAVVKPIKQMQIDMAKVKENTNKL